MLETFVENRAAMLAHIVDVLQNDERFVAAWLAGSFGRGEQDDLSDLDIHVVVAEAYNESLCARPWMHGARTTGERLALFRQFGEPSVIYEAHENAPEDGTFTYVLYRNALNVDWMLIPQATAFREQQTLLLFDRVGILAEEPPVQVSVQERAQEASVMVGFFWVMMPIAIKYMLRDKPVDFQGFLEGLYDTVARIEGLAAGEIVPYPRGARAPLCRDQEERIAAIRHLCDTVLGLMPAVADMGGYVAADPMAVINIWLAMADHSERQQAYAANRENVLARITGAFQADERFLAMWLSGSYARGEQDTLSDLDIRIVVADQYADQFCHVQWESARPQASEARLALVRQFGEPGIVWESKSWVGEGSCFTLTHYRATGLHIDWVFVPQATARLEREHLILFDKTGMLAFRQPEPESQEQRVITASDRVGSFWMMAPISVKYLIRGDLAYFYYLLNSLRFMLYEVQSVIEEKPQLYEPKLALTRAEQIAVLRDLCIRMQALMPDVERKGGYVPDRPMDVIEFWLETARSVKAQ